METAVEASFQLAESPAPTFLPQPPILRTLAPVNVLDRDILLPLLTKSKLVSEIEISDDGDLRFCRRVSSQV